MEQRRKLNIWIAALIGALVGAMIGAVRGIVVYDTFDVGFLFNHVLGGAVLGGFLLFVAVVVINWFRRHPA